MGTKLKPWGNGQELPEVFSFEHSNIINHMRRGNAEAVRAFFTKEPQWLSYYYHGRSLLHIAVSHDHPDVLAVLIDLGVDVNTPEEDQPWCAIDDAVSRNFLRSVQLLLERGATTVRQYNGLTFSCNTLYATDSGNFEMVKLLVDHGAPVDVLYDGPQRGLLSSALDSGHTELADCLRSKGALTDDEIKARDAKGKPKRKK